MKVPKTSRYRVYIKTFSNKTQISMNKHTCNNSSCLYTKFHCGKCNEIMHGHLIIRIFAIRAEKNAQIVILNPLSRTL